MFATRRALVDGHDAVGAAFRSQMHFDVHVGQRDVVGLLDESFDLVVCATTSPGGIWDRTEDRDRLTSIARTVARVRARHLVVVSGVDVYGRIDTPDETSPTGIGEIGERARLRAWFEEALREYHPSLLSVRLPAHLHTDVSASLLADLASLDEGDLPHGPRTYQLHDLGRLVAAVQRALDVGLTVVNLVSSPVDLGDIRAATGSTIATRYVAATAVPSVADVRTRHAGWFDGADGYVLAREATMAMLAEWWSTRLAIAAPARQVS